MQRSYKNWRTLHFRGVYERSMTPPVVVAHYIIWQPEWQRTEQRGSPVFFFLYTEGS